ncbi:MAG: metal-dependent hydrolase [Desulfurococcales archaeon]|nr:metal-dependent hydrolase [Desulfurococcales archaeon]
MASKTAHGFLAVGFLCISKLDCGLTYFVGALAGGLLPDFDLMWGHRKLLHTVLIPIALAVVGVLGVVSDPGFAYALALGWVSHLLSDGVTKRGVAFLWPFNHKFYHLTPRWLRPKSSSHLYNGFLVLVSIGMTVWRLGLHNLFQL